MYCKWTHNADIFAHILTNSIKPPHCRYQKCRNVSESSRFGRSSSMVVPEDNHHAQIAKYRASASWRKFEFLHSWQILWFWACRSAQMSDFVRFSRDWVQRKRQVLSRFAIMTLGLPLPYTMRTAFQLAWALSAINPLKFECSTPCWETTELGFSKKTSA